MNENDLVFYNEYFKKLENFELTKAFFFNNKEKRYEGEVRYNGLNFQVFIPEIYPMGELKFVTNDFEGLPHQNFDGSLCLSTKFVNHTINRLNLEIQKFETYISTYYEKEVKDTNYEYPTFKETGKAILIFQEEFFQNNRFETPFGQFQYSILNVLENQQKQIISVTALAQNLGNLEYEWAINYKMKEKFIGAWVFIDKEPIHNKKNRYKKWSDLMHLLPEGFVDFFRNFCSSSADYKLFPKEIANGNIFLAIGYKIPCKQGYEVHWDLILIPRGDFPRKSVQSIDRYSKDIMWDNTYNSSYSRFFGRGALNKNLADKKTLIIGVGAVGSSLSEILVRAGIKWIDFADVDIILPGNICRSGYDFAVVSYLKTVMLQQKLENISPFVQINIINNLMATSPKSSKYQETFDKLSSYDLIIDCTANNEIIQMLTDMKLGNLVCYISISNKAKEMIFVTNSDNFNIIERRNQMLYSFGTFTEPEFREGTGCWHPTFEASYFDINQLLNFTVRKFNSYFVNNELPKSFYSYIENDYISLSEDIKFFQEELNLTLTVESSILEKVEQYSREHFPNEFGGILMGSYLNNYIDLVISDVIVPEQYNCSPTKFEPNHKELNERIKEYFEHFNDKVIFVGDWHSHPNGSNQFSQSDYKSIEDVANSKTVNINNPILLIAAYGEEYFTPAFYVYNKNKLYKFERI